MVDVGVAGYQNNVAAINKVDPISSRDIVQKRRRPKAERQFYGGEKGRGDPVGSGR